MMRDPRTGQLIPVPNGQAPPRPAGIPVQTRPGPPQAPMGVPQIPQGPPPSRPQMPPQVPQQIP